MQSSFYPTKLDLALKRCPTVQAMNRDLIAASSVSETASTITEAESAGAAAQDAEPCHPASREGQMQTAAASLAAGMIAAEGRPVTAAMAVQKVREVMDELATT